MDEMLLKIDWKTLLLGEEKWEFLLEAAFRTLVMFIVILMSLRLLGKRGVKQLSVFELGVIIGLGSAAGDPMFYKDVGLLPGIVVFIIVISLYRLITFLINRSDHFEEFVEGTPTCIVEEGKFMMQNFRKEPIARDELFSQLRLHSVSHLGQVKQAIVETNGEVSIFYYDDENIKWGLPIIPSQLEQRHTTINTKAHYSCISCGKTMILEPAAGFACPLCHKKEWIKASNEKRER